MRKSQKEFRQQDRVETKEANVRLALEDSRINSRILNNALLEDNVRLAVESRELAIEILSLLNERVVKIDLIEKILGLVKKLQRILRPLAFGCAKARIFPTVSPTVFLMIS